MFECRICFEMDHLKQLILPCHCHQYVHRSCLFRWSELRRDNLQCCELCRGEYRGMTLYRKSLFPHYMAMVLSFIMITLFLMLSYAIVYWLIVMRLEPLLISFTGALMITFVLYYYFD